MQENTKHIVLYDGNCGLCSRSVRFISRRDRKSVFEYYPLQGYKGSELPEMKERNLSDPESVILITDGRLYERSDAALRILMLLGGIYHLSAIFLIIPVKWRNFVYDFIARNRHKWFKKETSCELPGN
jgi:predicted DCC family thiol-disulfide oxidoreductase YuxK